MKVLIVDDEPIARRRVRRLLRMEDDVEVVGECSGGQEAVAAIREHNPDLVFLDVQMPDLDGFGVVAALGEEKLPAIVFITAYDEYAVRAFDEFAIRAFEVHALDYLLKPFTKARFLEALRRARAELGRSDEGVRIQPRFHVLHALAQEV